MSRAAGPRGRLVRGRRPPASSARVGRALALAASLLLGCGPDASSRAGPPPPPQPREVPSSERIVLTVIGTNDLHGHIARLPVLSGFVANARRARQRDGGLLLIDAGDLFQGTLESNLVEGASVIRGYDAMRYLAAAVGNHEFDFGPEGSLTTPRTASDDPRGALIARAAQASFPLLTANILDAATGERASLHPNMPPTRMVEIAGVRVGVVGVSTFETLETTIAANVSDLRMRPLVETIVEHAGTLRAQGAAVVVVTAHAGGHCHETGDPDDLRSCEDQEIMRVARELPYGLVDVIVAGHSHQGMAHRVNGVAVIESFAYGVAFGRVDLVFDRAGGRVEEVRIHPPTPVCGALDVPLEDCRPGTYEGRPVVPDPEVARRVEADLRAADAARDRDLGVRVASLFDASRSDENALGNLLADLMLEARPDAHAALMNGGGIRAPLRPGTLTYGAFYLTFPFDNRFARVQLSGAELADLFRRNLTSGGSAWSVSGLTVEARCEGGELAVDLRRGRRRVRPGELLTVLTSDYVATTSDPVFRAARERGATALEDGPPMREALVEVLQRRSEIDPADPRLTSAARPRIRYEGARPVACAGAGASPL